MDSKQLRSIVIYGNRTVLESFVNPLNQAMAEFGINTPLRQAAFIAQVAHESGSFRYMEEIASGAAYDKRRDLGNLEEEAIAIAKKNKTTAGRWFKGHGCIQITGYYNHKECGLALGIDLVKSPRQICLPVNACRSAAWFWDSHRLNQLADRQEFKKITKIINGGYNGLDDRVNHYLRAMKNL